MFLLLSIAACVALAAADIVPVMLPSPPVDPETQRRLDEHMEELHRQAALNGEEPRNSFKSMWVTQTAVYSTRPSGPVVQIEATLTVSDAALKAGAQTVLGMVKFMHPTIFNTLSSNQVSLGIFGHQDKGGCTVFPEFANLRDRPECKGKCTGACANTCTGDGRKYETLGGLATTTLAAVHEDTVLCNERDPYRGNLNVAVHEFAHSLHMSNSRTSNPISREMIGSQISNAYRNARSKQIWEMSSYAMSNEYEYWAEGTGVYFNVDKYASAGGMNKCDGYNMNSCKSEAEARRRIESKDTMLAKALKEILTNNDNTKYTNLKTCMTK